MRLSDWLFCILLPRGHEPSRSIHPSSRRMNWAVWQKFNFAVGPLFSIFSFGFCQYLTQTGGITPLSVFSDAFPDHKMRVHLLTAPCILVIWAFTPPSTKGAFPPSDFCNGITDTLSVTNSKIPKSVTYLPYLTETLSLVIWTSDRVSVTDFLTHWANSETHFLSGKFKQRHICTPSECLWQRVHQ
jgi:hypothetical protein